MSGMMEWHTSQNITLLAVSLPGLVKSLGYEFFLLSKLTILIF